MKAHTTQEHRMKDEGRPSGSIRAAATERPSRWTNADYAEAVRQLAGTITSDCAGEIVLVVDDVYLYALARLDPGSRGEVGVYVSSVEIGAPSAGTVGHELVAGRKPLTALRDLIDRELASGGAGTASAGGAA